MKFGIDQPWYDNSVERVAFNLYSMHQSELDDAINKIFAGETNITFSFELTERDEDYIRRTLAAGGFVAPISFS